MTKDGNSHEVFDIVVAGGSATGVCAAVTAARLGLKVAIVEYNAFFGGMATAGLVPVWHSLWSTDGKTQVIGGLTDEIEKRMIARGEATESENPKITPHAGCYLNVAAMQITLDEFVREEANITPFLKAHVVGAEMDREGHLTAAVVEDKSGRRLLRAKWFIDATGDADLARRAGFETYLLPKRDIQGHSLCAILSGWTEREKAFPGKFSLGALLGPGGPAGLPHIFGWAAPVVGSPDLKFVSATRVLNCNPADAEELTGALLESRVQLRKIVDAANRAFPLPGGNPVSIVAIGSDLGIRESYHIKAKYKVTDEDLLMGRRFDDCALKGSYRIDIHEGAGITFKYLDGHQERLSLGADGRATYEEGNWRTDDGERPTWYEMPLRSLIPEKAGNLICAGRMMDCAPGAFGALRVMVNCNQTGESAARAVAKAIREGRESL